MIGRDADRWIAGRVDYLRIPGFLASDACERLAMLVRATSASRGAACTLDAGQNPDLSQIEARLCGLLGIATGRGGPWFARCFAANEPQPESPCVDSRWRSSISLYLNDIAAGGEVRFGGGALRPHQGTALIAQRPATLLDDQHCGPHEMPVRAGFKAVLTQYFADAVIDLRAPTRSLPLEHCHVPAALFASLRAFHDNRAAQAADELVPGFVEGAADRHPSRLQQLPDELQRAVHETLLPIVARWAQRTVEGTFVYGIRRYQRGAILKMHRDRPGTHIYGVSINVAQQLDAPWPLIIACDDGKLREIVLSPGEMVLYESERLPHGRPAPLRGDFYAGVFAHFRPGTDATSKLKTIGIGPCA